MGKEKEAHGSSEGKTLKEILDQYRERVDFDQGSSNSNQNPTEETTDLSDELKADTLKTVAKWASWASAPENKVKTSKEEDQLKVAKRASWASNSGEKIETPKEENQWKKDMVRRILDQRSGWS